MQVERLKVCEIERASDQRKSVAERDTQISQEIDR